MTFREESGGPEVSRLAGFSSGPKDPVQKGDLPGLEVIDAGAVRGSERGSGQAVSQGNRQGSAAQGRGRGHDRPADRGGPDRPAADPGGDPHGDRSPWGPGRARPEGGDAPR